MTTEEALTTLDGLATAYLNAKGRAARLEAGRELTRGCSRFWKAVRDETDGGTFEQALSAPAPKPKRAPRKTNGAKKEA